MTRDLGFSVCVFVHCITSGILITRTHDFDTKKHPQLYDITVKLYDITVADLFYWENLQNLYNFQRGISRVCKRAFSARIQNDIIPHYLATWLGILDNGHYLDNRQSCDCIKPINYYKIHRFFSWMQTKQYFKNIYDMDCVIYLLEHW